ncbi:MAG: hypothetical protein A3C02_03980 [Candidatus Andersenbacteria bacterium RIFCSPHIGHO2_02_FULL_45_11]|uniref:Prepilin-type N-terminal cleavage/methylation domain-containing protein n=1 Tax=Candidatus Andersenbacteria bacterium RIFCSPHIGHO2_12_FULL_45_11 TaxID=1797281 RepID=A0A1G1WZX1_9BACT|nr:MAG: hypothetical protein A2805_00695 [Candidatus Andersenbacteria bacterium RIFCSPHIGHO2_01_FULL_46_36]OGY33091.1 MAG: hypothetical protein A3D99_01380 [Candidatus Andersenbacteria bacterium RIFCSPHIGHO2_12_FULL_45_11]OGY33388.1 MAG: hypothetical protein A3C02_03980 [Candidatus Andersenbacteria bacterium RIFCSPHIGHO2_02_FULL_45_11]
MRGFTLIEILVAISISSIILVALVRLMGISIPVYRSLFLQTLADDTARVQLKRIAHQLREARPSDTGAYPIVEATAQKLIFYADIDGDIATERVRYELVGTDLVRGVIEPSGNPIVYDVVGEVSSIVARSIYNGSTPLFTYYGSNYPTDPNPLILPTPTP